MRSEIVKDTDTFISLADPWDRLAEQRGTPLLAHSWFLAGWQALHAADEMSIVVVWQLGQVVGIAPLVRVAHGLSHRLELIGTARLNEPSDLLFRDGESLRQLLLVVLSLGDPVLLQRVPEDSPTVEACTEIPKSKGITIIRRSSAVLSVAIESDWEDYYRSLSGKRRYDHRRAIKRAQTHGGFDVEMFCPNSEELAQGLNRFSAVEAAGWKGRKGTALFMRKDLHHFFLTVARAGCLDKRLRLYFLTIGGADAAAQMAISDSERLWILKIGYDERWAPCSPGVLLTWSVLRRCFAEGYETYEFLGSQEPWLEVWANRSRGHVSIGHYPFSPRSMARLCRDTWSFVVTKLKGWS